jgi:acyl-CoA reductase-like NAD-dependent aldehyde dehydrogenase
MKNVPVINPARISETVGEVPLFSERRVELVLADAQQAYASWSRTSPVERSQRLKDAADALAPAAEQLTTLFVRENGKPLKEAERDIARTIEFMRIVAEDLPEWWKPELYDAGQPVWARKRPRGVTAVISPWNSPVLLAFKRCIPAIAAGNTVVIKPATYCPLTVMECVRIMTPHFPKGVIQVVTGGGSTVGEILASDPRVRTIAFTGSTETGRRIMELAAQTIKSVVLELGGNDPALVLEDALLDAPAIGRMTQAILRASGQVCVAVKRIYVQESRYEELVDKLSGAFAEVVVGEGLNSKTTMGPLNNKSQFDFVTDLVTRCRERNLTVLTKGRPLHPAGWNSGYFMLPSIVLGAGPEDEIVSCEQFGPVVPILKFSIEEDAIALANAGEYGLRASVWTRERDHAAGIADRLEAGAVFFNNHGIFRDLHLDFPGIKQSGLGHSSRLAGLDHYADSYGFAD